MWRIITSVMSLSFLIGGTDLYTPGAFTAMLFWWISGYWTCALVAELCLRSNAKIPDDDCF